MPSTLHRYTRAASFASRLSRTLQACAAMLTLGLTLFCLVETHDREPRTIPAKLIVEPVRAEQRPVYPYSVIPGGVRTAEEVHTALRDDPLAAHHYAGFRAENAVLTWLRNDRYAYVSYRLNDRIYWTSHKVRIRQGEYVLTDGANAVRARCGNRISDRPQSPTSASEPSEEAMSWLPPAPPDTIASYTEIPDMPVPFELSVTTQPVLVLDWILTPTPLFLVQNRPWLGTPTPEPGTFVLLVAGAACLIVRRSRNIIKLS